MFSAIMRKVVVSAVLFLPLVFTFFFVYRFGLTIPYYDQWELVPLLEKMHNHTLTFVDLWKQHNEHRIIFPKILMLLLARLSNWNIFLELCTNMVLATFTFLFLLSILRSTSEITSFWLKMFFSLMIFSIVQWENWSWGWQIQFFLSVLGTVIAIWAANKWQGKAVGLAITILAAVLSSYSFSIGLLTWPVVLVVLLLQKKWKRKHIIILILACIATVLLYYHKYTKPVQHPQILFFLDNPLVFIRYVLTYLGASIAYSDSPLSWTYSLASIMAIVVLVLISWAIFNIWRFDRQKLSRLSPWLALALYACLSACATGLGRAGFGWKQALQCPRYTTISLFLPLSAAVLLYHSIMLDLTRLYCDSQQRSQGQTMYAGDVKPYKLRHKHGSRRIRMDKKKLSINLFFIVAIASMFIILYISSCLTGVKDMKEQSGSINRAAFCLTYPEIADERFLKRLYPDPNVIRSRIKTLSDVGIKFDR